MACTKNTERKPSWPPVARFPVIATGKAEREAHYRQKAAATTPTTEAMDWTELNPTLPRSTSPVLENTVNRLNEAHLGSTLTMDDVAEIMEDLHANPPTTPIDGTTSEAARPEDRQDLPITSTAPTGSVTSETTGQTSHPPILLERKAMATLVPIRVGLTHQQQQPNALVNTSGNLLRRWSPTENPGPRPCLLLGRSRRGQAHPPLAALCAIDPWAPLWEGPI